MNEKVPNWINLHTAVDRLIQATDPKTEAARNWATRVVRRELSESTWETTCSLLGLGYGVVLTRREALLHSLFSAPTKHATFVFDDQLAAEYPWVLPAMARGDLVLVLDINSAEASHRIQHFMEAVIAKEQTNNLALTLRHAEKLAEAWVAELVSAAELREGQIELVGTLAVEDTACSLYRLLDKQAVKREGKLMHHCVGSYTPSDTCHLYSLRHPSGNSIATVEVRAGPSPYIGQVKGPSNAHINAALVSSIRDLLQSQYDNKLDSGKILTLDFMDGAIGILPTTVSAFVDTRTVTDEMVDQIYNKLRQRGLFP